MSEASLKLTPALIVEDDLAMQGRWLALLREVESGAGAVVCASLAEAYVALKQHEFALVLVDMKLPDGSGCELIRHLQQLNPQLPVLVISAWGHEDLVLAALRAGAIGYLLKEREDIELKLSLRSVQRGGAPIDPVIARRILELLPQQQEPEPETSVQLSERELDVLQLIARGLSNRDIAEQLSLSKLTIEGYTKGIYRKLAVSSRTQAVFEAQHLGLLAK